MIKHVKKICCIIISCALISSTSSLNAFAWGTKTHADIFTGAVEMLQNDKPEIYGLLRQNYTAYSLLQNGTMSPD